MSGMTRRGLLGGAAVLVVAPMTTAALAHAHPDADLIAVCAEHAVNVAAYHRDGGLGDFDDYDPLWEACARTRDVISEAKPHTLDGMLAKARAAMAEATAGFSGDEDPDGTPAATWAWDLVKDLLAGKAVA